MNKDLVKRIEPVKLLMLDVDGVLTDGGLYYSNGGNSIKRFFVRDGTGIKLLQRVNIEVAFITGLKSDIVKHRAEDLDVKEVIQNCFDKKKAAGELLEKLGLDWHETAYLGDDVIDIPVMRNVGFAAAVVDAVEQVKKSAHYVTCLPGGGGAVREVCDLILKAKASSEYRP